MIELVELEEDGAWSAEWAVELGGVYRQMAETGLARVFNLERARDVFTVEVGKLESVPGERSPDAYNLLVRILAERGRVSKALHQETGDRKHLLAAADDYRKGRQQVDALAALAAAGSVPEKLKGGHGGPVRSYQVILDGLAPLGYEAERFALQELSTCVPLGDDARAGQLLPALLESPGSDKWRDRKVLEYAKARYGIATYPEFLKFWGELAAVEKVFRAFVTASQNTDHAAAFAVMAPGSPMAEIEKNVFEQQAAQLNKVYEKDSGRFLQIDETVIDGDWAAVLALSPIDHPKHSMYLVLKKTDAGWKVHSGDDFRFREPLKAKLESVRSGPRRLRGSRTAPRAQTRPR